MAQKFPLGFWNYNRGNFFTGPEEVERWHRLGMTMVTCPEFNPAHDDPAKLNAILDEVQKYGMTALLQIDGTFYGGGDEEEFEKKIADICEKYAKHPAVVGFYIGEEPDYNSLPKFGVTARIIKKVRPDLIPYMNLGSTDRCDVSMLHAERTVQRWLIDFEKETGIGVMGFGNYEIQELTPAGTEKFFKNLYDFVNASEAAGTDLWATLLSSSHYWFRTPTLADYFRQLSVCAASGCRGAIWFRLYDKFLAGDYRGSPFNEYGEETETFRYMSEAQRHFNDQYGELFMRLKHQNTYHITHAYGGYYLLTEGFQPCPLISKVVSPAAPYGTQSVQPIDGVMGLFDGGDGWTYAAFVNNTHDQPGCFEITLSEKATVAEDVLRNGEMTTASDFRLQPDGSRMNQLWVAPGRMSVIRIK